MGGNLLTTALMYKVFIPYIKDQTSKGNGEAQATLKEMINTKAEWLEDLILAPTIERSLKIGNLSKIMSFPSKDGRFERANVDEYGYPKQIKDAGEFYYWKPDNGEKAAVRSGGSVLGLVLYLNGWPGVVDSMLGLRLAKFLP